MKFAFQQPIIQNSRIGSIRVFLILSNMTLSYKTASFCNAYASNIGIISFNPNPVSIETLKKQLDYRIHSLCHVSFALMLFGQMRNGIPCDSRRGYVLGLVEDMDQLGTVSKKSFLERGLSFSSRNHADSMAFMVLSWRSRLNL